MCVCMLSESVPFVFPDFSLQTTVVDYSYSVSHLFFFSPHSINDFLSVCISSVMSSFIIPKENELAHSLSAPRCSISFIANFRDEFCLADAHLQTAFDRVRIEDICRD